MTIGALEVIVPSFFWYFTALSSQSLLWSSMQTASVLVDKEFWTFIHYLGLNDSCAVYWSYLETYENLSHIVKSFNIKLGYPMLLLWSV